MQGSASDGIHMQSYTSKRAKHKVVWMQGSGQRIYLGSGLGLGLQLGFVGAGFAWGYGWLGLGLRLGFGWG